MSQDASRATADYTVTVQEGSPKQRKNAATGASAAGTRAVLSQFLAFYFRAPIKAFFRSRVDYLVRWPESISPAWRLTRIGIRKSDQPTNTSEGGPVMADLDTWRTRARHTRAWLELHPKPGAPTDAGQSDGWSCLVHNLPPKLGIGL